MTNESKNTRFAFIGGGHITEILLDNWVGSSVIASEQVVVSSRGKGRLAKLQERFGVSVLQDNVTAVQEADLIFVNVRPEVVKTVVGELETAELAPNQLIISLAAGIPLAQYGRLSPEQPLVRAMPNPPSRIGQGLIALHFSPQVTETQRAVVQSLFSTLGQVVEVEETHFNVITALTSPVATYLFFQSLIEAGVRGGLKRPLATQIAAQTLIGSLGIWQAGDEPPYGLIAEASTPGGISVEVLYTLEQLGLKTAVMDAIAQGTARAEQLSVNSCQ